MLDFFYPWNQSRQDQKLDHDMNQHKERREYYRIQDTLALEFQSVPKEQALAQTPVMPFTLDPRFQILHALHELDHESHATLRQISDADRHLGSYLRTLNRKIELIAMGMFASSNSEAPSPTHDVTLSESGLSFRHEQPLAPDSHLALKLVLFPAYFGLLLFGRVVQCTRSPRLTPATRARPHPRRGCSTSVSNSPMSRRANGSCWPATSCASRRSSGASSAIAANRIHPRMAEPAHRFSPPPSRDHR